MDQGVQCLGTHLALILVATHLSNHSGQYPHILTGPAEASDDIVLKIISNVVGLGKSCG